MIDKRVRQARRYIIGGVLLTLSVFGVCCLGEAALLREAPYDVEIAECPDICSKLYLMDGGRHLLVLHVPGTSVRHGFIVNLQAKEIGIASLPDYLRLGRFALVNRMTLDGYCTVCGGLTADFAASGGNVILKVTGFVSDSQPADPDTESLIEEMLVYRKRITLKPNRV
jgi:hypothetical protein